MENIGNDFATTLAAAITSAGQTSITVASSTGAPAANFRIRIEDELMLVTAVAHPTWTVTRGIEGTTAVTHLNGADVAHVITKGGLDTYLGEGYSALGHNHDHGVLTGLSDDDHPQYGAIAQNETVSGAWTFASLAVDGAKFMDMPSNSTQRGPWNPVMTALRGAGRRLYADEDFATGVNSISVYNNAANGAVVHARDLHTNFEAGVTAPNSSGYSIKISYLNPPGAASPGFGGFLQQINSEDNHTFVQLFQAKVPSGRTLTIAENSQGTNNTSYWLTNVAGTGKWEWYARISHCGDSGTFSSGGHVYITGGADASFDWFLGSCTVLDVTEAPHFWTADNDGAGSGLDADLLDGLSSAAFALAGQPMLNATVAVATTLVIPTGYQLLVGNGYIIHGTLQVDGELHMVT